jgi:hypothetical protein
MKVIFSPLSFFKASFVLLNIEKILLHTPQDYLITIREMLAAIHKVCSGCKRGEKLSFCSLEMVLHFLS